MQSRASDSTHPQVYLLSAPSGSGKTTALIHYVDVLRKEGKTVGGVLQIVKNKRRHIRFLSDGSLKLLQVNDCHTHNIHHDPHYKQHAQNANGHCHHGHHDSKEDGYDKEKYIKLARFLCSKQVLNDCQDELNGAYKYDCVMIDEVGNWEMKKKMGYEPALSNVLSQRHEAFKNCNFIIVVQPQLKDKLIQYFDLKENEYADFEELYPWQWSLKLAKGVIMSSFVACVGWTVLKRYKKS
eukprot:571422_1